MTLTGILYIGGALMALGTVLLVIGIVRVWLVARENERRTKASFDEYELKRFYKDLGL